jgi:arabinan endo-1,5-alpha-L-arabinosidase
MDAGTLDARVFGGPAPQADGSAQLPAPDAGPRISGLVLRYDFAGRERELVDRVGNANARLLGGASLDDTGGLSLDGVDDYVDMPNQTLSTRTAVTIMAWVSWSGGVCWQRVFDFGNNDQEEGNAGSGVSALFLTLSTCPDRTAATVAEFPGRSNWAVSTTVLGPDRPVHLAVTFAPGRKLLTLYLDGMQIAQVGTNFALSEINDDNAWLGRSQWIQDRFARLRYDEFRIYDRPLDSAEISEAYANGPDVP